VGYVLCCFMSWYLAACVTSVLSSRSVCTDTKGKGTIFLVFGQCFFARRPQAQHQAADCPMCFRPSRKPQGSHMSAMHCSDCPELCFDRSAHVSIGVSLHAPKVPRRPCPPGATIDLNMSMHQHGRTFSTVVPCQQKQRRTVARL
jgi:hypothetical protein